MTDKEDKTVRQFVLFCHIVKSNATAARRSRKNPTINISETNVKQGKGNGLKP